MHLLLLCSAGHKSRSGLVTGCTNELLGRFCVGAAHPRDSLLRDSSVTGLLALELNGVKRAPATDRSSSLCRDFGLSKPIEESRRADSNRFPALYELDLCPPT